MEAKVSVITSLGVSMSAVMAGYVIAFAVGVSLAILCGLYKNAKRVILPIANFSRPVSAIALYPLIVTFIGIGWWARVFVLTWVSWSVVLINTLHAIESTDREIVDAARLDASRAEVMFLIRLPMAKLSMLATLNATISTTWIGLTAAEMLGASDGLGFKILDAAQSFNYPLMWSYILVVALAGFVMSELVQRIYKEMENR